MSEYVPTLDDVERLVGTHPQYFDSTLQTQRSIANARKGMSVTQESTAAAHYENYTSNGGPAIGPNGEMPAVESASDQTHGDATCDCEAATPCCIKKITFSCSHGKDRFVLPQPEGDARDCRVVFVTDKDPRPGIDKLKIKVEREPNPDCGMPGKMPLLSVLSSPQAIRAQGDSLEDDIYYGQNEELGGSDLVRFIKATKATLYSDIETLGREMPFEVQSCAGNTSWGSTLVYFPKLEWKANAFSFEISGKYDTNMKFTSGIKLEGSIAGTYGSSTFKIEGKGDSKTEPQEHTKSVIPFLDGALQKIRKRTKGGNTTGREGTASSITVKHKFTMADATFKLAEHPNDHSKIGVDSKVVIGYQPLFGVEAEIDLLDVLLTAAGKYPAAAPLAKALKKARNALNDGLGDKKKGPMYLAGQVYVKFIIGADIGNSEVTIERKVNEDKWRGSGSVGGSGRLELKAKIEVDGRWHFVKGTLSANASGSSKITATLKTLKPAEIEKSNGKKFNAKVDWNGVSVKYGASAAIGFGGAKASASSGGDIEVLPAEVLYDENL